MSGSRRELADPVLRLVVLVDAAEPESPATRRRRPGSARSAAAGRAAGSCRGPSRAGRRGGWRPGRRTGPPASPGAATSGSRSARARGRSSSPSGSSAASCGRRSSRSGGSTSYATSSSPVALVGMEDALVEVDHPVGAGGGLGVVRDHDDRLPELLVQAPQQARGSRRPTSRRGRPWARRRRGSSGRRRSPARSRRAAPGRRRAAADSGPCGPRGRRSRAPSRRACGARPSSDGVSRSGSSTFSNAVRTGSRL